MLTVVKPSPLRLWGFLLTALGGALIAFGAISDWAAVELGGSSAGAVTTKGIDLYQGMLVLALGVSILAGILVLRFVGGSGRIPVAVALLLAALASLAVTIWCATSLEAVVTDEQNIDALIRLATASGIPAAEARALILETLDRLGITVVAQLGLWLSLLGSVVATAGAVLDLMWVRRKRRVGDAIDPDTDPAAQRAGVDPGDVRGD
jgi:hypothetical protein